MEKNIFPVILNDLRVPLSGEKDILVDRYKISTWLAFGGSSSVYRAKDLLLKKEVLIKECYPKVVRERFVFKRDEKGSLQIPDGTDSRIADEMNDEKYICLQRLDREMEILSNISTDNPYTIFMEVLDVFETNNTKYVVYPFRNLMPMSKTPVLTILSALQKTRWALKNLKPLFEAGYLHLDVSIDNMINTGIGEEDPVITLIDFNSACKISDCSNKVKPALSKKVGFSAPELYAVPIDYDKIDIRADLYSVAASLFYWLHKRPISGMDVLDEDRICLRGMSPIAKSESSELIAKCNDILKMGLANATEERYKSIEAFETDLDSAIFIAQEWSNHYLTKSVYENPARILFRESFINDLYNDISNIRNDGGIARLLIYGYGGIGKTSVSKCLFSKIKDKFRYVAYVNYHGSLINSFEDVMPRYYRDGQDQKKRFELICDFFTEKDRAKNTLLILDGADVITPDEIDTLVNLEIHLVMTIRVWAGKSDHFIKKELEWLTPEQCIDVFYAYFEHDKDREYIEAVKQIVNIAYYHTLSVELFAKAANVYVPFNYLPKYLEELKIKGYKVTDYGVVTAHDLEKISISQHLTKLFSMIVLTEEQKRIAKNFAIMAQIEIPYDEIDNLLQCTYLDLQALEDLGRISQGESGYYMHGVTGEAVKLGAEITVDDFVDIVMAMSNKYFHFETPSLEPSRYNVSMLEPLKTVEDFKCARKYLEISERFLQALIDADRDSDSVMCLFYVGILTLHLCSVTNPKKIHKWVELLKGLFYESGKINDTTKFPDGFYELSQKMIKFYDSYDANDSSFIKSIDPTFDMSPLYGGTEKSYMVMQLSTAAANGNHFIIGRMLARFAILIYVLEAARKMTKKEDGFLVYLKAVIQGLHKGTGVGEGIILFRATLACMGAPMVPSKMRNSTKLIKRLEDLLKFADDNFRYTQFRKDFLEMILPALIVACDNAKDQELFTKYYGMLLDSGNIMLQLRVQDLFISKYINEKDTANLWKTLNETLMIAKKVYDDENNPEVVKYYRLLGNISAWRGNYTDSLNYYLIALERTHQDDTDDFCSVTNSIGHKYITCIECELSQTLNEDVAKARKCFEFVLTAKKNKVVQKKEIVRAYMGLSWLDAYTGNCIGAIKILEESKKYFSKTDSMQIHMAYARIYETKGNIDAAIREVRKTLEWVIKSYGKHSISVAYFYYELGRLYAQVQNKTEALKVFEKALKIYENYSLNEDDGNIIRAKTAINDLYEHDSKKIK